MSRLVSDDALLDDLAAAVAALRVWLMQLGEQHADLDASALDVLLGRYEVETGRRPSR